MHKNYTVITRSKSTYEIIKTIRLFKHDVWLMVFEGKPQVITGLRKKGEFIPISKVRSKRKFKGREITFHSADERNKELPEEYWLSTLCPSTSRVESIK